MREAKEEHFTHNCPVLWSRRPAFLVSSLSYFFAHFTLAPVVFFACKVDEEGKEREEERKRTKKRDEDFCERGVGEKQRLRSLLSG